jgi:hypothetical protein
LPLRSTPPPTRSARLIALTSDDLRDAPPLLLDSEAARTT